LKVVDGPRLWFISRGKLLGGLGALAKAKGTVRDDEGA
jgi:hypothetical protein